MTDALVTHGIPVLANSSVPLERDGRRLWLAGIEDALEQRPDLAAALPAGRSNEPVILLAHEPDFADYASDARLASFSPDIHTEGKSRSLSAAASAPRLGDDTCTGSSGCDDGMQLNVNRGIGAVILPFRFRCPPEITVITLRRDDQRPEKRRSGHSMRT